MHHEPEEFHNIVPVALHVQESRESYASFVIRILSARRIRPEAEDIAEIPRHAHEISPLAISLFHHRSKQCPMAIGNVTESTLRPQRAGNSKHRFLALGHLQPVQICRIVGFQRPGFFGRASFEVGDLDGT